MALPDSLQAALGPAVVVDHELVDEAPAHVFVARDGASGHSVAVTILPADVVGDGVDVGRLNAEIARIPRLEHPQIIPVLRAGTTVDGHTFLVTPYENRATVRHASRGDIMSVDQAIGTLRGVAAALAFAHDRGVVHGRLSPDNVFTAEGSTLVSEFGIARALSAARTGAQSQSPAVGDHRVDIYAFGLLGYELLSGRTPNVAPAADGNVASAHSEKQEPIRNGRPDLPASLAALIMQCLEPRPGDRPQTAAGIVRALDDVAATREAHDPDSDGILSSLWPVESPTLVARSQQFRNRLFFTLVTVALLFGAAVFVQWRWGNTPAAPPRAADALAQRGAIGTAAGAKRSTSPAANELYSRALSLQAKRTERDVRESLALFHAALVADPRYALAWSGIADSWALLGDDFVAPASAVGALREAVASGIAIDSSSPDLRFDQGVIAYLVNHDTRAAQWYMAGALAANAGIASAPHWYPQVLWLNGLRDSASAFLRRAVDRDSTSVATLSDAWSYAHAAGNTREARRYCGRLIELRMGARCSAVEELEVGRPDPAVQLFRPIDQPAARQPSAVLDYVRALVGARRASDARAAVAEAARTMQASTTYIRHDEVALMYGLLGDNDTALQWYERARAAGSFGIGEMYWRTVDNPVRKDPRLIAFARRAGLENPPAYWP